MDARAVGPAQRHAVRAQGRRAASTTPCARSTPGVAAISVSNHGGNNLDGTPGRDPDGQARSPTRSATRSRCVMDGGVRRGSDVVKALALGARAVLIGRAYLWGLAANGQAGVENVLDVLRGGIDSALLGLGLSSIDELDARARCWSRTASTARSVTGRAPGARPMATSPRRPARASRRPRAGAGRLDRAARPAPAARHRHRDRRPRSPRRRAPSCRAPGSRRRSSYGSSGEHQSFPGTTSIGTEALTPRRRRAGPLAAHLGRRGSCSSTPTAATSPPPRRTPSDEDSSWVPCATEDGRPPRRVHRDLADAAPAPGVGAARPRRGRQHPAVERDPPRDDGRRRRRGLAQRRARRPDRRHRRRGRSGCSKAMVADVARAGCRDCRVALVTGAAGGIGSATVAPPRSSRGTPSSALDRARHRCPRQLERDGCAPRRSRDVRDRAALAGRGRPRARPLGPPRRRRRRGRGHRRRPAAVGDARRGAADAAVDVDVRGVWNTAAVAVPAMLAGPDPQRLPVRRRRLGGRRRTGSSTSPATTPPSTPSSAS